MLITSSLDPGIIPKNVIKKYNNLDIQSGKRVRIIKYSYHSNYKIMYFQSYNGSRLLEKNILNDNFI